MNEKLDNKIFSVSCQFYMEKILKTNNMQKFSIS